MNIFFSAFGQSDAFGKLIFLGLFILSGWSWIILLYKVWMMRHVKRTCLAFQKVIGENKERLLDLELSALPRPGKEEVPHPFAHILGETTGKTIEVLKKNHYFMEAQGEEGAVYLTEADMTLIETQGLFAISKQKKLLERNLFILATTVTLAPFLGLLGTVWGILVTFTQLHAGATLSSNQLILGGLSTALATTVLGLVIAIPALVSYNYLKNSVRTQVSDMEDFLSSVLTTLEMQYRKV